MLLLYHKAIVKYYAKIFTTKKLVQEIALLLLTTKTVFNVRCSLEEIVKKVEIILRLKKPVKKNVKLYVCNKRIWPGSCLAYIPRYGYNKTTEQCEEFIYGGCGGTANNFETLEECENTCEVGCDKPIIRGLCLEFTERCAYNKWTRQCQKFWFGGCGGNGNNYETLEECEEECESE